MLHPWGAMTTLGQWLAGFWLFWRIDTCGTEDQNDLPGVRLSIIIPARNEERNLPRLLSSLAQQTFPPHEIIVVNDHSTDGTTQVARRAGVRLLDAPDPPEGWIGKTWACWTGAQGASGDSLLFLDADTRLAPGGLAKMASEHRHRGGGFLSLYPYHRMEEFYERMSAFPQLVSIMGLGIFSPFVSSWKRRNAFGQCLLFSREQYFAVGGHAAIRTQILEGPAFGERFRRKNWPVHCLGGRGVIELRMYPEGIRQVMDGWSKNFQTGMKVGGGLGLFLVILWLSGCFDALTTAARALIHPGSTPVLWAAGLYAAFVFQIHWMLRRIGNFGFLTALAFPISLIFFSFVFVYWIVLAVIFRRVRWRGRTISTRLVKQGEPSSG